MAKLQKGDKLRLGKPLPHKRCDGCGETKSVRRFPKRSGRYKKYPARDLRRYDNQCKRCRKPSYPGQSRDDVAEPRCIKHSMGVKEGHKTRKRMAAAERERLTKKQYKRKVRKETRIQSMVYLAKHGCEECGERDPRKLEYDHKNGDDKERNISDLISNGYSWTSPVMVAEIRKCRVICSNCHRLHTIVQQGYYAFKDVQRTLGKLAARYKFKL